MKGAMPITLNLEEALFVKSAMITTLKQMNKQDLQIFWEGADIPNVLRQLDITIDVLFAGGKKWT